MINCSKCNAELPDNALVCPHCGEIIEHKIKLDEGVKRGGKYKTAAALSYFGLIWCIPAFMRRDDTFIRFHLNQGLALLILRVIFYIVNWYAGKITGLGLIFSLLSVLLLLLMILGVADAVRGETHSLPVISKIKFFK